MDDSEIIALVIILGIGYWVYTQKYKAVPMSYKLLPSNRPHPVINPTVTPMKIVSTSPNHYTMTQPSSIIQNEVSSKRPGQIIYANPTPKPSIGGPVYTRTIKSQSSTGVSNPVINATVYRRSNNTSRILMK